MTTLLNFAQSITTSRLVLRFFFAALTGLMLSGCINTQQKTTVVTVEESASISPTSEFRKKVIQIKQSIETHQYTNASDITDQIDQLSLQASNEDEKLLTVYLQSLLHFSEGDFDLASTLINTPQVNEQIILSDNDTQVLIGLLQAEIAFSKGNSLEAARIRVYLAPMITNQEQYLLNHNNIWLAISTLSKEEIATANSLQSNNTLKHWLELASIVRYSDTSLESQLINIDAWQGNYPTHPAALVPPHDISVIRIAVTQKPSSIAVILPFDGKYQAYSEAIRDGLMHGYFASADRPAIKFYSYASEDGFIPTYEEAIFDGAELVIGPLLKKHITELLAYPSLPVPTVALNRVDENELQILPDNLYQLSLSKEDEIQSLVNLALQQDFQNIAILNQSVSWADEAALQFSEAWTDLDRTVLSINSFSKSREQSASIQSLLNIDKSKQRINELRWTTGLKFESKVRTRQDIDMILLLAKPEMASSVRPLLAFHFANDIPVYANSNVYRGFPQPQKDKDLHGVYFTELPFVISNNLETINYSDTPLIRMFAFGFDAYQFSERFSLITTDPDTKLYGATGVLTLGANGVMTRELGLATFKHGRIIPVTTDAL